MREVHSDRLLESVSHVSLATSAWLSSALPQAIGDTNIDFFSSSQIKQKFNRREMIPLKPQQIWRIDQGCARTITNNANGEVITLGFWRSGEFVSQPRFDVSPYQIECLTFVQATLLATPSKDDRQMLTARVQQTQAQQAQALLIILHSRQMESRLMNLLRWFAQQFGQEITHGWLIDLRLTHQDIADVIGTTRVTVTRLLKKLAKAGTIQWSRQRQIVLSNELI